ncbi:MAG: hypothetical protein OEY77_15715, partial [Nitrospira sp.]|nr:hypothetical protein [Nitrospira sp.]
MDLEQLSKHSTHTATSLRMRLALCGLVIAWLTAVPVFAEPSLSGAGVPVRFHGETLFTLQTGLANIDTASRAAAIEKRLDRLTHATLSVIDSLRVEDHE